MPYVIAGNSGRVESQQEPGPYFLWTRRQVHYGKEQSEAEAVVTIAVCGIVLLIPMGVWACVVEPRKYSGVVECSAASKCFCSVREDEDCSVREMLNAEEE